MKNTPSLSSLARQTADNIVAPGSCNYEQHNTKTVQHALDVLHEFWLQAETLIDAVCVAFHCTRTELKGNTKDAHVVDARHTVCLLLEDLGFGHKEICKTINKTQGDVKWLLNRRKTSKRVEALTLKLHKTYGN